MKIEYRNINEEDYKAVYKFQNAYLDKESFSSFKHRINKYPDLYVVAVHENDIIGICYGSVFDKDRSYILLEGVAVNLSKAGFFARKGIGSNLIKEFSKAVKKRGKHKITLGSAEDHKVEMFYIKNRFNPVELVVFDSHHKELDRVKVKGYKVGLKLREELQKKYRPEEVIFIFEKSL